eukprot:gene35001-47026_t
MKEMDITEVAQRSGVPASTLRYYDEKGLIVPIGRRGLRRLFDAGVLERLALIALGRTAGFSLDEIARMFGADGQPRIDRLMLTAKADEHRRRDQPDDEDLAYAADEHLVGQRRAGALGVHSIDHFAVQVPDLTVARDFYDAFGLDVKDEADGLALYARGNAQRWARYTQGPVKQLSYLCFGVYAEDLDALAVRLDSNGVTRIDRPGEGLWIEGFDGLPINIRVAEKCSPDSKTRVVTASTAAGQSGAIFNSAAPKVHPRALSHFAIYTTDVIAATAWYEANLGLRLSDGSGPVVAFLH